VRLLWICFVAALTLIGVRLVTQNKPMAKVFIEAQPGDVICRHDGEPWSKAGALAFVIVTSPSTCSACRASLDFGDELCAYGRAHSIPVYYVVPNRSAADSGALEIKSTGRVVLREDLTEFGIVNLPTYLRVDNFGVIRSMWTGTVSPAAHDEITESLVSGSSLEAYQTISSDELQGYINKAEVQLLALSELNRRPGSKMIPFSEMDVRAHYELDSNLVTIVDCQTTLHPSQCQAAARMLVKSRFKKVVVAGLPKRVSDCKIPPNMGPVTLP
jgi:hypothetical protein